MPQGRLEVLLIDAKGLDNFSFLDNVDPYVILMCRTQEQRSSVVSRQTMPEWNETFVFTISGGVTELSLKIMDKDMFSSDDSLELISSRCSRRDLFGRDIQCRQGPGQIRVSLAFIPEECYDRELAQEESHGGWKQSSFD